MSQASLAATNPALGPPHTRLRVHLGLLGLTVVTTTVAGMGMATAALPLFDRVRVGLGFSLTLLGILLTHEMGHYVFARLHRVDTSLPYVIPGPPLLTMGTFGAVIRMRSPIPTRDALIDIGASGPIAGLIVALPLLALGLLWSPVVASPTADHSFWVGNQTLLSLAREALAHLQAHLAHLPPPLATPRHDTALGDNLLMRGMTRLILGPLAPGHDIRIHPVGMAAWFGLLVTSLNLFPIGQLDGGHVSYAMLGERGHRWLSHAASFGLLALACFSSVSWLLWWVVTRYFLGFSHPPLQRELGAGGKVGGLRTAIAVVSLLLLIATLIPVPMDQV